MRFVAPTPTNDLDARVACPGCDLLHRRTRLRPGERARCIRCGDVIACNQPSSIDRVLAASLAGTLLIVVGLGLPFIGLSQNGVDSRISLLDAVWALWQSDMRWLGIAVLAFMIVLPLLRFLLLTYVFARVRLGRKATGLDRQALHWAIVLEPWAMAEVFMVGVVVSLVKVAHFAHLDVGWAFWAVLALIGIIVYVKLSLCRDTAWQAVT